MHPFTSFIVCGHCRLRTEAVFTPATGHAIRTYFSKDGRPEVAYGVPNAFAPGQKAGAAVGFCNHCGKPTLLCYLSDNGERTNAPEVGPLTITHQFPAADPVEAPKGWPEKVALAWADVQKMEQAGVSPAMLATAIGTCLQAALRELGSEGKNIYTEINDLRDKGVITAPMSEWAHRLRKQRNDGTHDFMGDTAEASEAIDFLRLFLKLTFTLRLEIQEISKRPNVNVDGSDA